MSPPRFTKTLTINPPLLPTAELCLLGRLNLRVKQRNRDCSLGLKKYGQVNGRFYSKLQNHLINVKI